MVIPQGTIAALLGGLLPALVWLFFWLREDRCEPEPKWRIAITFVAGAIAVGLVLPLEQAANSYFSGLPLLIIWAATEELFKFGAAAFFGLKSRAYNEPIDAVIYMVTAALGFAAAENTLFLWGPLHSAQFMQGFLTDDTRFIGATLLHTLASSIVGLSLAFTFNVPLEKKIKAVVGALILATALHALFNFFILQTGGAVGLIVFLAIWIGIIAVLYLLERIKDPLRDYC